MQIKWNHIISNVTERYNVIEGCNEHMVESTIVCNKKKHTKKIIKAVRDLLGHDNIKIIYCKEILTGNIQFGVSYDDVTNYFERFGEKYDDDMLAYNFAQGLIENINFLFQEQKNG